MSLIDLGYLAALRENENESDKVSIKFGQALPMSFIQITNASNQCFFDDPKIL